jgi:carbamoyltransferase
LRSILGISAYYHDSAAALIVDGKIIACAQEERFTRIKHDQSFPSHSVSYCLREGGLKLEAVDYVVFYDKPLLKFERILETAITTAPRGLKLFLESMPVWLKDKLFLKAELRKKLSEVGHISEKMLPKLLFTEHHESHAASCFYPSPYDEAAVLCLDGVGEWATTTGWHGKNNKMDALWQIDFPHSLGLLYSAVTAYAGFKVNSGEYKLMGLAPYGDAKYVKQIRDELVDVKADGSFRLNMDYFSYLTDMKMYNQKFEKLFGKKARSPEAVLTQHEMDMAKSIQVVTEDIVVALAKNMLLQTGSKNLCMAGGVALNCVANGRVQREVTENLYIQPAAGDAGGALGAALQTWYIYLGEKRVAEPNDSMKGAYLGPEFRESIIAKLLNSDSIPHKHLTDQELDEEVASAINDGKVIGWFQGRMEFGPRALGNRSIIGDARNEKMQEQMNLKIKFRESFRPFAPIVLEEDVSKVFEYKGTSPYMLICAYLRDEWKTQLSSEEKESESKLFGLERLYHKRSKLPAITHVDYSARLQTVSKSTNPKLHSLMSKFKEKSGVGVLVNTSFNVRGEPIVCSPEDALRCFLSTDIDILALGNYVLHKDQMNQDIINKWGRSKAAVAMD